MKGGRGQNLPNEDNILRYVPWGRLLKDEHDNVIGFLPQAFQRREDEDYLSVNWIEFHDGNRDTQVRLSVWAIRESFDNPLGGKSAFALGSVSMVKQVSEKAGSRVRIVHEPQTKNPAHSGIRRLPRDDLTLLEALAADAFTERVNNADIAAKPVDPEP